jgi:tRNA U34 5-methylaminomethyl-2-thiouridine-forming methyltransferase MnmC
VNEKVNPGPHVEIVTSADGSDTVYVPSLNEHYHSVFGAINESRHVFIAAGLNYVRKSLSSINILEVGFGTGLNALLTCLETCSDNLLVNYTGIEFAPLAEVILSKLNYVEKIDHPEVSTIFDHLHSSPWGTLTWINPHFSLMKIHGSVLEFLFEQAHYDLVYFDAFGPDVQPEMWSLAVFHKMASALKPGGVLVTYSTKGMVKRNLKEAGFMLEKLPGPVGKREILRAILL